MYFQDSIVEENMTIPALVNTPVPKRKFSDDSEEMNERKKSHNDLYFSKNEISAEMMQVENSDSSKEAETKGFSTFKTRWQ